MEYVDVVWSASRHEYGYRFADRVTWCGSHEHAVALAQLVAARNGVWVNDGTPQGYPAVEAHYRV